MYVPTLYMRSTQDPEDQNTAHARPFPRIDPASRPVTFAIFVTSVTFVTFIIFQHELLCTVYLRTSIHLSTATPDADHSDIFALHPHLHPPNHIYTARPKCGRYDTIAFGPSPIEIACLTSFSTARL